MSFLHVVNIKYIVVVVFCIVNLIFLAWSQHFSLGSDQLHNLPEARVNVCVLAAQLARHSLQGPRKPQHCVVTVCRTALLVRDTPVSLQEVCFSTVHLRPD